MHKKAAKIHIVGAGISGLIAATVLETHGYHPIIIEGTASAGGRVKTDIVNGYSLDRGFQVLLTAYPAAQKYLDFQKLDLQYFLPGATIFENGKQKTIGDPLRDLTFLLPTLFSGIGSIADKLKIIKLNQLLKKTTLAEIFLKPEITTHAYLVNFGFSPAFITQFFQPFFSGIFLEPELQTSSRMFEFVYKMFGEGSAALPKTGIEAIPNQLKNNLKQTTFLFNSTVKNIEEGKISLTSGLELVSDYTIVATEASPLIKNLRNQETTWLSCDNLYFETDAKVIQKPLIGLIADKNALINNLFYPNTSNEKQALLSVTIVKPHQLSPEALINEVKKELKLYCGIENAIFLKHYPITKALPKLDGLKYEIYPSETKLTNSIFLAGDTQLNGSLNAAMISGEKAALGVIELLSNTMQ
ncbi:FAD-dependent oxidoreductase [Putridiphycobacter roseus]|uniref:FAD-dependent oxidoreductase n=1 Tax=Putridiphycobacter roseus TaxID=2219161 RepID=A0A2W1ND64_9FLAO|nr:FAD-dependent oxidoreductase [Putridiphycobacter roseus]PZE16016.1 FAD-dependent oxidoreductase [Putridiphycobacter roseus]